MNDKKIILFQGDSLTDAGRVRNTREANLSMGDGFVSMIAGSLTYQYPFIDVLNRGVAGDRIADTYSRWQEDALNIKYDLISILHGINDVGFGIRLGKGSDAGRYEFIYDRMLYEIKETNPSAQIVLCQPFILRKDLTDTGYSPEFHNDIYVDWEKWSSEMKRRGEIVRKLSEKYHTMYVPMWDDLNKAQERMPAERLTMDCIHLTATGNYVLAQSWLKATAGYFEKLANERN